MADMTTRAHAAGVAGPRTPYGDQRTHRRSATDVPTGDGGERSDGTPRHATVYHDGVAIPVTRGGLGRPLVLCPGLHSTQADLRELTELLRRDHDVVTFDLRGHGLASTADRYTFDGFLSDLVAVLAYVESLDLPSPPVLMGYSLGADLAVHYAAEAPDAVAELVLIDGANPLPEPFINEENLAEFRAMAEESVTRQRAEPAAEAAARQVSLTARDTLDLQREIDVVRSGILDRYRRIDRPISMIMSAAIAGDSGEGQAPRHNRLWHAGVERLVRERPHVRVCWLDADHRLVLTHAPDIADRVRTATGRSS